MNNNDSFEGEKYRLATNWYSMLLLENYNKKPINYLEIGSFYGGNIISVAESYGIHDSSKLFCIDPYEDYADYPEYKNKQEEIYKSFLKNIEPHSKKITHIRGYSQKEIPKFEDNMFDIIYIDGNHEPEYVLEDAVLSFRKLKSNGILIFDDYGWGGPDLIKRGIDGFISGYHKKIKYLGEKETQVFVIKL
jgi:predicted O-methyltransferase YrrM